MEQQGLTGRCHEQTTTAAASAQAAATGRRSRGSTPAGRKSTSEMIETCLNVIANHTHTLQLFVMCTHAAAVDVVETAARYILGRSHQASDS